MLITCAVVIEKIMSTATFNYGTGTDIATPGIINRIYREKNLINKKK